MPQVGVDLANSAGRFRCHVAGRARARGTVQARVRAPCSSPACHAGHRLRRRGLADTTHRGRAGEPVGRGGPPRPRPGFGVPRAGRRGDDHRASATSRTWLETSTVALVARGGGAAQRCLGRAVGGLVEDDRGRRAAWRRALHPGPYRPRGATRRRRRPGRGGRGGVDAQWLGRARRWKLSLEDAPTRRGWEPRTRRPPAVGRRARAVVFALGRNRPPGSVAVGRGRCRPSSRIAAESSRRSPKLLTSRS